MDLAGLMPPHLLFPIESRSLERQLGQISILLHRLLSPVKCKMMDAMVVNQFSHFHGCITMKPPMRPVPPIQLEATTMARSAPQFLSAETAIHINHASSQMSTLSTKSTSLLTSRERKR